MVRSARTKDAPKRNEGILLGWRTDVDPETFGFASRMECDKHRPSESKYEAVNYNGDSHIMVVAPTRSGKGRGWVIPTCLEYDGPLVVIDPKGENTIVTARRRREMGQKVVILDPFNLVTDESDRFNPFDLFQLKRPSIEDDARMMASMCAVGMGFSKDPFWDSMATGILSGLIAHIATGLPKSDQNMRQLLKYVFTDDTVYNLAVLLDTKTVKCPMAYRELAAFLQLPERETRPSVLATAVSYLNALHSEKVMHALGDSSFDLNDIVSGKPLSIFIVVPPEKLKSHAPLIRLWISTLMAAVSTRKRIPEKRTLFILDEVAQLATLPMLESAITLMAGYGMQVATIWQDFSQIQKCYTAWETLVNNCAVLLAFGAGHSHTARNLSDIMDCDASLVRKLPPENLLMFRQGQSEPMVCRRLDYLNDPLFSGKFDPNPRFDDPERK